MPDFEISFQIDTVRTGTVRVSAPDEFRAVEVLERIAYGVLEDSSDQDEQKIYAINCVETRGKSDFSWEKDVAHAQI